MQRYALVLNGAVDNVVESADPPAGWVLCGNAGPGWSYDGGQFLPPQPAGTAVPASVSPAQAQLALFAVGKLAAVEAAIDAMPEPDQTAARIRWTRSTEFLRDDPLVILLGQALGLSESDIDQLFVEASAL